MKNISKIRAFTLIELLVVVAIIAILTGIVMANLTGSKSRARDAKRVSDINQLQLALEQGFDKCQQYPGVATLELNSTICNGVYFGDFISTIPKDPVTGAAYGYYRKQSGSKTIDYILQTILENNTSNLDQITYSSTGWSPSVPNCSLANKQYCVTSK